MRRRGWRWEVLAAVGEAGVGGGAGASGLLWGEGHGSALLFWCERSRSWGKWGCAAGDGWGGWAGVGDRGVQGRWRWFAASHLRGYDSVNRV